MKLTDILRRLLPGGEPWTEEALAEAHSVLDRIETDLEGVLPEETAPPTSESVPTPEATDIPESSSTPAPTSEPTSTVPIPEVVSESTTVGAVPEPDPELGESQPTRDNSEVDPSVGSPEISPESVEPSTSGT